MRRPEMRVVPKRGIPVWRHLPKGRARKTWLKHDHRCTSGKGGCLRFDGSFSYCSKYSYRG